MKKVLIILITVLFCLMISGCSEGNTGTKETVIDVESSGQGNERIMDEEMTDLNGGVTETAVIPGNTNGKKRIKITGDVLNVRKDKTTDSEIIGKAYEDNVYEVIGEGKDADNRPWYKIYSDFGVKGWVAGWFCEETSGNINSRIRSGKGELLYLNECKDFFVDILLMDDYSLDVLLDKFGDDYTVTERYLYNTYGYENGMKIDTYREDGNVKSIEIDDRVLDVNDIEKITCDIFENDGNEIVIFYEIGMYYYMLVLDAETKAILRDYSLGYYHMYDWKVEDFLNDGKLELYIYGLAKDSRQRDMFRVVDDDFVKIYGINAFGFFKEGIRAGIRNNEFSLDINIGDYCASEKSPVAQRVFYNTRDTPDKNELLSVDTEWEVKEINGKWFVKVRNTVNIIMLEFYWGPPKLNMQYNSIMLNDLARIDVLVQLNGDKVTVENIDYAVKYNDVKLLNTVPILFDEACLVDGPSLGMEMEEAYEALGGDREDFEYTNGLEYNGVSLFEFCGEVVDITVLTDGYMTPRGLKVGDTIEKVESLYGKPDAGFSGDDYVEYKFCYGENDQIRVTYYTTLIVHYENGLVSKFGLHQVILD